MNTPPLPMLDEVLSVCWPDLMAMCERLGVPAHAIKKGSHSSAPKCPIHVRRQRREQSESLTQRALRDLKPTPDEGFEPRSPHSVSGSQREPLSSVLSLPRQRQAPHDQPNGATA